MAPRFSCLGATRRSRRHRNCAVRHSPRTGLRVVPSLARAGSAFLIFACASPGLRPAIAAEVAQARLEAADAEPENWLLPFQNLSSHRYSRLTDITRANVAALRVAFAVPLSTAFRGRSYTELENAPLVDDGAMFLDDGAGTVLAIDVSAGDRGRILWTADAAMAPGVPPRTRGLAFWSNAVIQNLRDGRVLALDRQSGELLWEEQVARVDHAGDAGLSPATEGFTAAPLAVEGKVLVGQSNGDGGNRGWLAALDATNGTEIWRTYTVPRPGEPGGESWRDDHNAWKTGGGGLWTTGSYDSATRLTIWGTGNPVPVFDPEFRPGDNLFTDSAVAFAIADGAIRWHFQYTPNDSWDYDEQGVHLLYDAPVAGVLRKIVGHFGRNGFFYQLDRETGAFVSATRYVSDVTWTAGIDPATGKPEEYDPALAVQTYVPATRFLRGDRDVSPACPHAVAAVRWQPPAYNPAKGVAYSAAGDGCFTIAVRPAVAAGPEGGIREATPGGLMGARYEDARSAGLHGLLTAIDVSTGTRIAALEQPYPNLSGVLATAGGLLFSATIDGFVTAYDDDTLAELWRFNTGISTKAPPIAYAVGGRQYIAVAAGAPPPSAQPFMQAYPEVSAMIPGAMLFVFSLP